MLCVLWISLTSQTYQLTYQSNGNPFPTGPITSGSYLGTPTSPNRNVGVYTFAFTIPQGLSLRLNLTYNNTINPEIIDYIHISITNPNKSSTIVGDPQFIGLRGQSYQVHGVDGAVYNLISEHNTQVNARFTFLSSGACPIINGIADTNCWAHPGSYLSELSFQQHVDSILHALLVTAGTAKQGFSYIQMDGKPLRVGDTVSYGSFSVSFNSTHSVTINMEHFVFILTNSDMFVNQAVRAVVPLSQLGECHGLLGQTHSNRVYPTALRYIVGGIDDYSIVGDDIFGDSFPYNQFQSE